MTERRYTRMGNTIAGLREQRRWSQRALAKAFGISFLAAMERSNAAHKLSRKRQTGLTAELRRLEWRLRGAGRAPRAGAYARLGAARPGGE